MPRYHLHDLRRCQCGKPATVEIRNERNAPYGVYCDPCGKRKLKQLEAAA